MQNTQVDREEVVSQVSWDEFFMRHAYLAATKSKDPSTKVGAILVKNGIIISEGYNGFARGVKDYRFRYDDRSTKYLFVVHGEMNAVLNAVRNGINTDGSVCYTQEIPCHECTKALIQAGVSEIIVHDGWPKLQGKWPESIVLSRVMCAEAGIKIRVFKCELKVCAFANGQVVAV